jgi:hypothetical protein
MRFAFSGSLCVFVNGQTEPSQDEWAAYCAACEALAKRVGRIRIYVYTAGGAPNAFQRKSSAETAARYGVRTAVVSDSVVAQVIGRAIALFNENTRVFSTNQTEGAKEYLSLTEEEAAWVTVTIAKLRAELAAR